jgi:hypothetical protein
VGVHCIRAVPAKFAGDASNEPQVESGPTWHEAPWNVARVKVERNAARRCIEQHESVVEPSAPRPASELESHALLTTDFEAAQKVKHSFHDS